MKSFFKYLLATVVGIIVSSILLFFIFIGIAGAIVSSQEKPLEVKPGSVLVLKLDKPIVDRKPVLPFFIKALSDQQQIGLNELLESIDNAKKDDRIEGIYLDVQYLSAGIATVEEIRDALLDFRESGKFVVSYGEFYSQGAFYMATAGDKVFFNPKGFFNFVGLRTQSIFLENALEKLDIEPTLVKRGSYKSAGEMFTEEEYSSANREQLSLLINTIWDDVRVNIGTQRGVSTDKLDEIANDLLIRSAEDAYQYKLIDSVIYKDELISYLKSLTDLEPTEDLRTVSYSDYKKVPKQKGYKGLAKDKIAVIYASGNIIMGEGDETSVGGEKFSKAIRKIRADSSIKAVVLRVNSPGGSAIASEVIWRELYLTRQSKPVVVSMGDVAASGGYYISCIADTIVAQPNTITGSIGVYSMFLNAQGFFNKYGITFDTEKTNDHADFMSAVRPPHPAEIAYWEVQTDSIYQTFLKRVSAGRNMSVDAVHEIAQGRIWSGIDAKERGLVDELGSLGDAIEIARNMAGLGEKYRLVDYPKQEDPFEKMIKELTEEMKIRLLPEELGLDKTYLELVNEVSNAQGPQMRMPVDITIY